MSQDPSAQTRRELRQRFRQQRRALDTRQRRQTALRIAKYIERAGWLKSGQGVAAYLASAEEISCLPLIRRALQRRCRLLLPQIIRYRKRQMRFAPAGQHYRRNRFGILEPDTRTFMAVRRLHLVLVPLVAYDARGHRLGMGAGYYDRALQGRLLRLRGLWPRLVGIAHSTQRVEALPTLATDVPLDAVVTERGIERFTTD